MQVWRLFVVYNRNWYVIILPVLVLLVNAGKLNRILIYPPFTVAERIYSRRLLHHMDIRGSPSWQQYLRIFAHLRHNFLRFYHGYQCRLHGYVLVICLAQLSPVNPPTLAAIAYRIYATRRGLGMGMPNTLMPVTIAIVESGALYAVAVLSLLIAYLAHTDGQYAALDAVSPLIVRISNVGRSAEF